MGPVSIRDVVPNVGTTLEGTDTINAVLFDPTVVDPEYVFRIIVPVPVFAFGIWDINALGSGTHVVDVPTFVAIVPVKPPKVYFTVCVYADDFLFVLMVNADEPSNGNDDGDTVGTDGVDTATTLETVG